jgi:hypothetical protein
VAIKNYPEQTQKVEAILFARGKHAFNMGDRSQYSSIRNWLQSMAEWMNDSGFLKP